MIIECGNCKRKFRTDDPEAAARGGEVVCPKCGHVSAAGAADCEYGGGQGSHAEEEKGFTPPPVTDRPNEPGTFEELRSEVLEEISSSGSFDINTDSVHTEERGPAALVDSSGGPAGSDRSLPGDGGNWEQFVNISRTEAAPEDFITKNKSKEDTDRHDSDFDWDDLRVDRESPMPRTEPPRMFEDEGMDEGEIILRKPKEEEPQRRRPAAEAGERKGSEPGRTPADLLFVDMDALSQNPYAGAQGAGRAAEGARYDRVKFKPARGGSGIAAKLAYFVLAVLVFSAIIGGTYVILLNTGYIPAKTAARVESTLKSLIPGGLALPAGNEVRITQHQGRWLDTRNGPIYVISGMVKNVSGHPVSFIKVESEFISAGQVLYQNTVYAGNTLTENELRVSALQDVLLKLQKKTGDIDFYNPDKLAGLNYNVKAGESIPFYAVFHPSGRVLGLKYNLRVAGYESEPADWE